MDCATLGRIDGLKIRGILTPVAKRTLLEKKILDIQERILQNVVSQGLRGTRVWARETLRNRGYRLPAGRYEPINISEKGGG